MADEGDAYWNNGDGWRPITGFDADFDGNNDSDPAGDGGPYAIRNIYGGSVFAAAAGSTRITPPASVFGGMGQNANVYNLSQDGARAASDNDSDNDNLIEVTTLAQLNAIRWDLNGDGTPESNTTSYNSAFDSGVTGCSSTCTGYELSNDLDLDTDGDGMADSGDTYWNSGSGWQPIGDTATGFSGDFDGNGYTISNLFINRTSSSTNTFAGLFGEVESGAEIEDLALTGVNVTFTGQTGGSTTDIWVGALAGRSAGTISEVDGYGTVKGVQPSATGSGNDPQAGGLVGRMVGGSITASSFDGTVTAEQNDGNDGRGVLRRRAGGLQDQRRDQGVVHRGQRQGDHVPVERRRCNRQRRRAGGRGPRREHRRLLLRRGRQRRGKGCRHR